MASIQARHHIECEPAVLERVQHPQGLPTMALFTFAQKVLTGDLIDDFNHGNQA